MSKPTPDPGATLDSLPAVPPPQPTIEQPPPAAAVSDSAGTLDHHQPSGETGEFHSGAANTDFQVAQSAGTSDFLNAPDSEASLRTLAAPTAPRELPTLPGYQIESELGRGGMGVVYKARQVGLNRTVALKMVLAGAHASPDKLARFHTEAVSVARVQHPNIVQIYEVGEHDGLPYFSLEYIDGSPLDKKIDRKPQKPREAAELVEPLARAMHFAHERNIVHRDLKPANVLVTRDGVPKLTDFGLAKAVESDDSHTRSGTILGSPSYMAPEQARGDIHEVGPLSDQYGVGAILYELLTGRPPFQGATVFDTLDQVQSREPVPPTQLAPRVPVDLETICLKCLQKEPAKRYPDCGALADDSLRDNADFQALLGRVREQLQSG
jgi:serine/threonine-protein kinase